MSKLDKKSNSNGKSNYDSLDNFVDDHQWFTPRTSSAHKNTRNRPVPITPTSRSTKSTSSHFNNPHESIPVNQHQPDNTNSQPQAPAPKVQNPNNDLLNNVKNEVFKIKLTHIINRVLQENSEQEGTFVASKYNIFAKLNPRLTFNLTNTTIPEYTPWPERPQLRLTDRGVIEYPLGAKIPIVYNKINTDIVNHKTVQIVKNEDVLIKITLDQLQQIVNDCIDDAINKLKQNI